MKGAASHWALLALLAMSSRASAHHSFAQFDSSRCLEITGVFRAIEWTFPHTWIWVSVPEGSPNALIWGFEGDSPAVLTRNGWARDSLKPGDRVTVQFAPLRDGRQGGAYGSVKRADGVLLRGTINARSCKLPPPSPMQNRPAAAVN